MVATESDSRRRLLRRRSTGEKSSRPVPWENEEEYYEETETSDTSELSSASDSDDFDKALKGFECEAVVLKNPLHMETNNNKKTKQHIIKIDSKEAEDEEEEEEEEEIIIIEQGSDDDDNSDFERKIRKRVLKHLRNQQQQQAHAKKKHSKKSKKKSREDKEEDGEKHIQWDLEWEAIKNTVWGAIGFFVPPVVYLPAMFLVRVFLVWPIFISFRTAMFTHRVFMKTWPMILEFLHNFVQFPHRLLFRILEFSEAFAYRSIEYLRRIRAKLMHWSIHSYTSAFSLLQYLVGVFVRLIKKSRKQVKRGFRRLRKWASGVFGSTKSGVLHLLYIVFLPVRVVALGVKSFAFAGTITLSSFTSIPSKVVHFIVHSPHIFGRSGKKVVKFFRNNRRDIVDVFIALIFLTVLGMILSGVFFPLLVNLLKAAVMLFRHLQTMFSRLRMPHLRLPRFNWAKLWAMLPPLPFNLPTLPFPDLALLFGLRERTFMEKVMYVFS